jgi:hypothetical protein
MSCVHLRDVRSPIRRAHLNAKGGLDASRGPIHWDADLQLKSIMRLLSLEAMFDCP